MQKATTERHSNKAALSFIFVMVVLDVMAIGIIIPVLPKLVESMVGGNTPRAAEIFGLFGTAWGLMQFVFSPILGALSDRFGRRPIVLFSTLGLGLDYILMAVAPTLAWLFLGRIISGITAASFSTANAYIADVTPPEQRASAFGLIGAAFGIGFVLGPALGGILGQFDPRLPFWVAAGLSLANAAYGYFVLPESLPPNRRMRFAWSRANPIGSLRLLAQRRVLLGLAGVAFLYHLAHVVLPAVAVLYTSYRYGWDTMTMGLTLAAVGVTAGVVQAGLIRPIISWLGERATLILGLLCGVIGFAIYGLATTGTGFWTGIPIMALWGVGGAAAMGIMSRLVGGSEQGQLQGANSSLIALAGLIGPFLCSYVFARSIDPQATWQLPGAAFLLAAAMLLLAAVLAWWVTRPVSAAQATQDSSLPARYKLARPTRTPSQDQSHGRQS
jgi:DHA1 family tetracycline resistance protein-like MFS transporter